MLREIRAERGDAIHFTRMFGPVLTPEAKYALE